MEAGGAVILDLLRRQTQPPPTPCFQKPQVACLSVCEGGHFVSFLNSREGIPGTKRSLSWVAGVWIVLLVRTAVAAAVCILAPLEGGPVLNGKSSSFLKHCDGGGGVLPPLASEDTLNPERMFQECGWCRGHFGNGEITLRDCLVGLRPTKSLVKIPDEGACSFVAGKTEESLVGLTEFYSSISFEGLEPNPSNARTSSKHYTPGVILD